MTSQSFLPQAFVDRAQQRVPDVPTGSSSWVGGLQEAPAVALQALAGGGAEREVGSVVVEDEAPATWIDREGLLVGPGWRHELLGLASGTGGIEGEAVRLVEGPVPGACDDPVACAMAITAGVEQLGRYFVAAAGHLEESLQGRCAELLSQPSLVADMSEVFATSAYIGVSLMFSALGGIVGAGGVGGAVGSLVRKSVAESIRTYGRSRGAVGQLSTSDVSSFFDDYAAAWSLALYATQLQVANGDLEELQVFSEAVNALASTPATTMEAFAAALLQPFLQLGATLPDSNDPFGMPRGHYDYRLQFAYDGEGGVHATTVRMPDAIGPEQADVLARTPGLWATQTFTFVSDDGFLVGVADPKGDVRVVEVAPWCRELLQQLGSDEPYELEARRYDAAQGDPGAQADLRRFEDAGMTLLWERLLDEVGAFTRFVEVPGLQVLVP